MKIAKKTKKQKTKKKKKNRGQWATADKKKKKKSCMSVVHKLILKASHPIVIQIGLNERAKF